MSAALALLYDNPVGVGDALEFKLPDGRVVPVTVAENFLFVLPNSPQAVSPMRLGYIKEVRNLTRRWTHAVV